MFKQVMATAVVGVVMSTAVIAPTTVSATTPIDANNITIHYDNWGEAKPGTLVSLGSRNVADGKYNVTVVTKNQHSTHPGNNIIVTSGSSRVEVKDVESKPYVTLTATGVLTVTGGKINVQLYVGSDGLYSTGVDLVLKKATCETNPEMDECKPKPVEPVMIDVCRLSDMSKVTINEKDFDNKRYSKDLANCKKPEVPVVKNIDVCKLSDMSKVTIAEDKFDSKLYSKDLATCKKVETPVPTPEPQVKGVTTAPVEIAKTGTGIVSTLVAGAVAATAYGVTYLRRR